MFDEELLRQTYGNDWALYRTSNLLFFSAAAADVLSLDEFKILSYAIWKMQHRETDDTSFDCHITTKELKNILGIDSSMPIGDSLDLLYSTTRAFSSKILQLLHIGDTAPRYANSPVVIGVSFRDGVLTIRFDSYVAKEYIIDVQSDYFTRDITQLLDIQEKQ